MYGEDAFYPETREPGRGELENVNEFKQEREPTGMRECLIRFFGQSQGQAIYLETWQNRQS